MKTLKKTVKILSGVQDALVLVICLVLMLLGIYSFIDNAYLFNTAADKSILRFKPGLNEPIAGNRLITENQVAWIRIEGSGVDFPVLQGGDNAEYLNKDPYGEFSFSGSIFLDSRNSADFSDCYSIIYGHHMSGGHMFGCLDRFLDDSFLTEHRTGALVTRDKAFDLTIFAAVKCLASDRFIFEPEEKNQEEMLQYIKEHASVYKGEPKGKLIALTTCTSEGDDSRLAVIGYLKERMVTE